VIKTFKETVASIQDPNYGQVIISKPFRPALWYWTKYLILISVIPLIIGIFAFTRYLPESPKFIQDKFPEGKLTFKSNHLSTSLKEPYQVGNQDFVFIIDTKGDAKELAGFTSGVLLLTDKAVIKTQDNQLEDQDYSKIPDFSITKAQLSSWVSQHLFALWLGGFVIILILGMVSFGLAWAFRLAIYLLWALAFWIFGKYLLKKTLTFLQSLSIVLYASIVQLVLSLFLAIAPNQLLDALGTVLFVYFAFTWLRNLPAALVTAPPAVHLIPLKNRSRKTKSPK
jgi:hypothetical protein